MSVKTYDWGFAEMEERGDGDYVLLTDYESLQRERDALREALENYMAAQSGGKKVCGHEFYCVCPSELVANVLAKGASQ